jgi:hypothetical protein
MLAEIPSLSKLTGTSIAIWIGLAGISSLQRSDSAQKREPIARFLLGYHAAVLRLVEPFGQLRFAILRR